MAKKEVKWNKKIGFIELNKINLKFLIEFAIISSLFERMCILLGQFAVASTEAFEQ